MTNPSFKNPAYGPAKEQKLKTLTRRTHEFQMLTCEVNHLHVFYIRTSLLRIIQLHFFRACTHELHYTSDSFMHYFTLQVKQVGMLSVRAGASQPSGSVGVAHTVIPIQRQHAHKIDAEAEGRTVFAGLKLPRPESVDQLETERRLDSEGAEKKDTRLSNETLTNLYKQRIYPSFMYHPAMTCLHCSFHIMASLHVHVSTTCFILHVTLHVHLPTITSQDVLVSTTQLDRSRSPTMPCILLYSMNRRTEKF